MKKFVLAFLLVASPVFTGVAFASRPSDTRQAKQTRGATETPKTASSAEEARWVQEARDVTIIRDNWGIAHVYGKTDADAVFGVLYAQAEDDFNRVETNYLNAMGRLAEVEGESEVYRDLRMKIFINPDDMKAEYESSPSWLKAL